MPKCFNSIYTAVRHFDESSFSMKREYLSSEKSEFEGKMIVQSSYKIDDPTKRYKGKKVSDFSLENQVAVGVPLSPVTCNPSLLSIESSISKSLKDGK